MEGGLRCMTAGCPHGESSSGSRRLPLFSPTLLRRRSFSDRFDCMSGSIRRTRVVDEDRRRLEQRDCEDRKAGLRERRRTVETVDGSRFELRDDRRAALRRAFRAPALDDSHSRRAPPTAPHAPRSWRLSVRHGNEAEGVYVHCFEAHERVRPGGGVGTLAPCCEPTLCHSTSLGRTLAFVDACVLFVHALLRVHTCEHLYIQSFWGGGVDRRWGWVVCMVCVRARGGRERTVFVSSLFFTFYSVHLCATEIQIIDCTQRVVERRRCKKKE